MQDVQRDFTKNMTTFGASESRESVLGGNDWAVPWADLMMVMFVLFVVLFIYASTHQDVKVLFSAASAEEARATSSLDPLIGLIGQISSRVDGGAGQDIIGVTGNEVLYRSRKDGVSVVREGGGRIRVTLRGDLFFANNDALLKPGSDAYVQKIGEVVRLNVGSVHVVGYASRDEGLGMDSFGLSTARATEVARHLVDDFGVEPNRIIISGRGAYVPELPGTSPANMALNRRVEILITNGN